MTKCSVHRRLTPAAIALVALTAAAPASAGEVGAGILGGVIGGVIGGAITNANRNREVRTREVIVERERPVTRYVDRPRTRYVRPAVDPYTREQNRRTQQALNYFGFNAGAPDGLLGRQSRSAVRGYQAYMNFPITGYLDPSQQSFLVTSYDRALAGGATTQVVVGNPNGVRALLPHYYGGGQAVAVGQPAAPVVVAAQPQQQPQQNITINVPQQQQAAAPAAPAAPEPQTLVAAAPAATPAAEPPAAPAAPSGALPMFVTGPIEASMSSFCARVGAPSPLPGADVQNASLSTEGENVLASQFCSTRANALVESDRLAHSIQGVTRTQMQQQCESFAPSMDPYVAKLVSEGSASAKSALQAYVVGTGISMQALAANSRICLGIGYGADNARVTLASSMILVGIGEVGFGEVLGYHLAYGFGAPENRARAADWLDDAASGLGAGARPVIADADPSRPQLLQAMATRLRGAPAQTAAQPVVAPPAAGFQMPVAAEEEPKKQL